MLITALLAMLSPALAHSPAAAAAELGEQLAAVTAEAAALSDSTSRDDIVTCREHTHALAHLLLAIEPTEEDADPVLAQVIALDTMLDDIERAEPDRWNEASREIAQTAQDIEALSQELLKAAGFPAVAMAH
ncbi:MAG: hypothetical protein ACI8S6_005135 [Myxococcota bacterium]|jgi:hypothetical protein